MTMGLPCLCNNQLYVRTVVASGKDSNRPSNIIFRSALDKRKADGNIVPVIYCRLGTRVRLEYGQIILRTAYFEKSGGESEAGLILEKQSSVEKTHLGSVSR